MTQFPPRNPAFEALVRETVARQQVLTTLGAELTSVEAGATEIRFPFRQEMTQQHGFLHAGIVTTVVDTACGAAALSLMPEQSGVLTIEYKVNFLAPAAGDYFVARGRVIRPGRNVMVCTGEVIAFQGEQETTIAIIQTTMMIVRDRPTIQG
jgi:uncharacterized protein (TIGR00369 family)